MRLINEIIVHCAATPEGQHFDIDDIRSWHKERGFDREGYHFIIYLDGTIVEGRPITMIGAHVSGRNSHTIGICYIGGVAGDGRTAKDTRTSAQEHALVSLLERLVREHPTINRISGHNEYANKACPSFNARNEFRDLIERARAATGLIEPPDVEEEEDGEEYRVTGRRANFRAGPGMRERVTGSLPKNTVVTATGQISGGWIQVRTRLGYVGWVHESLLTPHAIKDNLVRSRTAWGSASAGVGGAAIVAEGAVELQTALQSADSQISTGTVLGLVIGLVVLVGAGAALYARWTDAGSPLPGRRSVA